MSYLQLNEQDFQEYLFDIDSATFSKRNRSETLYPSDFKKNKLGFFDIKTEQKGKIGIMHQKFLLNQDIHLNFKGEKDAILFFFVKRGGGMYFTNNRVGIQQSFTSNTHGIHFMHIDTANDKDILQKDKEQEFTMFFIPISYYERLTNLYPYLFEQSFTRDQKGESFFLSKNFARTTAVHYNILSQIENSHLMGTCNTAYVDAKILELLSMYFQYANSNKTTYPKQLINYDKIKEAEFILISELHNPPSVKELALRVGVNPNILQAGFKRVFNTTVYGYLFDYKMQLAEQLLRDTGKSITEIALQCGYDYPSHFCTAFKRKFGVSPNAWKMK